MRTDVKGTRAVLRHSGTAPNKVRAVLGLIRGLSVAEARDVLQFCERGAAEASPAARNTDSNPPMAQAKEIHNKVVIAICS